MKQSSPMLQSVLSRAFVICLVVSLLGSLFCAVLLSLHWPFVGDASLMHYVVFLMSRGLKPYKQIVDINLPGSYLFEAAAMRLYGGGALAWRLYDLTLLLLMGVAALLITTRRNAFPALFATSLFSLIHIQDGIAQLGQRDLLIAVLLLWSYAALFTGQRSLKPNRWIFLFALAMGVSFTIKPSFLPLGLLLLLIAAWQRHRSAPRSTSAAQLLGSGSAGLLLPSICAALWLYTQGALGSFVHIATTLVPFHSSLGRRPFVYLVTHITSPIVVLCALWLLVLAVERPKLTLERIELLVGVAAAFLAYLGQGKGFPYHRYPFLALLLLLMAIDLVEAATMPRTRFSRALAAVTLAIACFGLAPRFVRSFTPDTPFEQSLSTQLAAFGPQLSGQVQCLDTFGGCVNTLYDLRLVQSTGYLYDCYLFTSHQTPVTAQYRADFWTALQVSHPKVIVLTDQFCFGDPAGFHKLDSWPQLRDRLARDYIQTAEWQSSTMERWWARPEYPPRYRIYVSRESGLVRR